MMLRCPRLVLVVLVGAIGCTEGPPDDGARLAFESLMKALDDKDPAALWALADDETHALFEALASDINDALSRIESCYPEELLQQARAAVGGKYLFREGRGEALFRALLDPAALQVPKDPNARTVLRVKLGRRSATVVTGTHDTFVFYLDKSGHYRTDLFRKAIARQEALAELKRNIETVKKECPAPKPEPSQTSGQ